MPNPIRRIGPFLGLQSSLGPQMVGDNFSPDLLNVTVEDGAVRPRNGFGVWDAGPGGTFTSRGFGYLQGYDSNDAVVEEFWSVENRAGTIKPYSINPSTGARTEILNGVTALSLNNSVWRAFAFREVSYFYNPNESPSVFKHTIGSATSWTHKNNPTAPASKPTVNVWGTSGTDDSNATTDWTNFDVSPTSDQAAYSGSRDDYNGGTGWSVLGTGNLFSPSVSSGNLVLTCSSSALIVVPLTDIGAQVEMWLGNGDATEKVIKPSRTETRRIDSSTAPKVRALAEWDTKTYDDWDNIKWLYVKLTFKSSVGAYSYTLRLTVADIGSAGNKDWQDYYSIGLNITGAISGGELTTLTLSRLEFGGAPLCSYDEGRPQRATKNVQFAVKYYNPTSGLESVMGLVKGVGDPTLEGQRVNVDRLSGAPIPAWGSWLSVSLAAGDISGAPSGATKWKLYALFDDTVGWKYIDDEDLANPITIRKAWSDFNETDTVSEFDVLGKVVCATPFKAWVVWGYKGGESNVKHSRVGQPEIQQNDADDPEDLTRGESYTLSDNFADDPLSMFECGDSLVVVGSKGVYAQWGNRPCEMTPFKRLHNSAGGANAFACERWQDANGNPGVVYVDRFGEGVWFASALGARDTSESNDVVELTAGIRGFLKSFLMTGQSLTDFSTCRVAVDQSRDSLWVMMGNRALCLRRPSLVDGNRHWEAYEYVLGSSVTIAYPCFTPYYGPRWMRSNGKIDKVERNVTGTFAAGTLAQADSTYVGASKDDGAAITSTSSIYWKSKTFVGENRRIKRIGVGRDSLTDRPTLTVTSSRQASAATQLASGAYFAQFYFLQSGIEHNFKLNLEDGSGAVKFLEVEEIPYGQRPKQ